MNSCSDFHLLLLHLLLPISLPFLSFVANAQTYSTISLGSSLSSGKEKTSWASPSGEFAFGFHPLRETDLFVLSIWFDKIPEKTVVWSANGAKPVQSGSKLELTTTGELLLTDRQGREVWKRGRGTTAYASLLDTGNLVLANMNFDYIWQSFEEPTDTLLPTQMLGMDSKLFSRQTETNFTRGRFSFGFQSKGNLVLSKEGEINDHNVPYWASNTVDTVNQLMFNQSGYITLMLINGTNLNLTSSNVPPRDFYQRATLDFDGVFRQYGYPKTSARNGSWNQAWSVLDSIGLDICMKIGSGVCGFNSYCRLDDDQRPSCICPPKFTYLDPSNKFEGCKSDFVLESCGDQKGSGKGSRHDQIEMVELLNTDWPIRVFELHRYVNEDTCRKACLDDCHCQVARFREGHCWQKTLPLSNGRMAASVGGKTLIKVPRGNITTFSSSSDVGTEGIQGFDKRKLIIGISVGAASLLAACFIFFIVQRRKCFMFLLERFPLCNLLCFSKKKTSVPQNVEAFLQSYGSLAPRRFNYSDLKKMTNSFIHKLGQGGYGSVFKGMLRDGRLVAVKLLIESKCNGEEFMNEVASIGRTYHINIVTLLGYCSEGSKRALIYEYMPNGSLDKFIFVETARPLEWEKLCGIAVGIARGLEYLHRGCSTRILHFDIKPHNILLDQDYCPKISDFGLAKLCPTNDSMVSMLGARGTVGYIAPEVFSRNFGKVSYKSDVYSYGMMVLEMVGGRKNIDAHVENISEIYFPQWIYKRIDQQRDLDLHGIVTEEDEIMARKMILVSLWCIQTNPGSRPSMSRVVEMLEGRLEGLEMPPEPFISSPPRSEQEDMDTIPLL